MSRRPGRDDILVYCVLCLETNKDFVFQFYGFQSFVTFLIKRTQSLFTYRGIVPWNRIYIQIVFENKIIKTGM